MNFDDEPVQLPQEITELVDRIKLMLQHLSPVVSCLMTDFDSHYKLTGQLGRIRNETELDDRIVIAAKISTSIGRGRASNIKVDPGDEGWIYSADIAKK